MGNESRSFIDDVECYVTPSKVWRYFNDNLDKLQENMVEIAHNSNNGTSVFITEDNGIPHLYVDVYGEKACDVYCCTEQETSETLRDIYSEYILLLECNKSHNSFSEEGVIDDRENELRDAFMQFLDVVVDDTGFLYLPSYEEDVQRMLDYVIEYIAIDNELSVYRPMFIEDDNGTEEYVEYPYEEVSIPTEE